MSLQSTSDVVFKSEDSGPQIISIQQLQAMLAVKKGARIVTLTTITHPELKKTAPKELRDVVKISRINGIVNFNYANAVNRQRYREGKEADFTPKKRTWGTRLDGLPFVSHINKEGQHKLYLEVKVERVISSEYHTNDGLLLEKYKLTPFLKKKESNADYQGLDKEVVMRDFDINNIATVTIDGQSYVLRK